MPSSVPFAVFLVGAALDVFQTLIMDLDTEGRYLFLNAVANQLRYPNNHTHYFSFILLYLFAESNQVLKCFLLVFWFIFVVVTCWFLFYFIIVAFIVQWWCSSWLDGPLYDVRGSKCLYMCTHTLPLPLSFPHGRLQSKRVKIHFFFDFLIFDIHFSCFWNEIYIFENCKVIGYNS